jgi:hypothetical protein
MSFWKDDAIEEWKFVNLIWEQVRAGIHRRFIMRINVLDYTYSKWWDELIKYSEEIFK